MMHKLPPMLDCSQAHGSAAVARSFPRRHGTSLSSFMHLLRESTRAEEEKVAYLYAGHHDTVLIDVSADWHLPAHAARCGHEVRGRFG